MPIDKKEKLFIILNKAIKNDGICLSNEYINSRSLLSFKCKNNHYFNSTSDRIMRGHWCLRCSGSAKLTINIINDQIKSKNIVCISNDADYSGNKCILKWKCLLCNFIFEKSKNFIDKDFTICINCRKYNLNQNVKVISKQQKLLNRLKSVDGYCFDIRYQSSKQKMSFKCKNNHTFEMSYNNFVNIGNWCKYCSKTNNISESICRAYFEQLFNEKFETIRPQWLKKNNGYNLELDGYCAELNLAFEHQGTHHYIDRFDRLQSTIRNDKAKLDMCIKNNVNLIIIPQLFHKTKFSKLKQFIVLECCKLGITIPNIESDINLSNCYKNNKDDKFKEIQEFILNKGKCLSKEYYGSANHKLIWECKFGHQWEQYPYVIKKGHWCPKCSGQNHSKNIIK